MQPILIVRGLLLSVAIAGVLLVASVRAACDTLHLKDGRVLEGSVVKEGDGYIFFKYGVEPNERTELFVRADIERLVSDQPTSEPDEADPEALIPPAEPDTGAPRIAVLNFGPPSDWRGEVADIVGVQINANAWREAIPLLEADGVDVVVVRVNSGGGYPDAVESFHDVFEEYRKRFRTVVWLESTINHAAMSVWVLEEMYFLPEGSVGASTGVGWSWGNTAGWVDYWIQVMDEASERAGRSPTILRAMLIQYPLSVDVDEETGVVTWRQDEDGQLLLNRRGDIYTMNSAEGIQTRFARGVAATRDELAGALGYTERTFGGDHAARHIDESMREVDRIHKELGERFDEYRFAVELASDLPIGSNERRKRVARARELLPEVRALAERHPNSDWLYGMDDDWLEVQDELLTDLERAD